MLHREAVKAETLDLLTALMAKPELSDFYLTGGTALALQIGHRLSVDLDLFGNRPFAAAEIIDAVSDLGLMTILSQSHNILVLSLRDVKVDFVNYRYPLISDPVLQDGSRMMSTADIGAMKLAAIAGRGRKRDFFDLCYLLKHYSLAELLEFYSDKFSDGNRLMILRSLVYFDDADSDDEPVILQERLTWSMVKSTILKTVAEFDE